MLGSLVKGTEWEKLFHLAPSFFDVLPMTTLLTQTKHLAKHYRDAGMFENAMLERDRTLADRAIPVVLRARHHRAPDTHAMRSGMDPQHRADTVLTVFFHQLLVGGTTLLDLRHEVFTGHADTLVWTPRPAMARMDIAFLGALRRMYEGFYGDDAALMDGAMEELGLLPAKELFLEQFGGAAHGPMVFRLKDFQAGFTRIFERCVQARIRLPGDFLGFGIMLATLHEHLDALGVPVDGKAAFVRAGGVLPSTGAARKRHAHHGARA